MFGPVALRDTGCVHWDMVDWFLLHNSVMLKSKLYIYVYVFKRFFFFKLSVGKELWK